MKGLGTDEANLIRVLATKTNDQILALNRRFSHRYGDKGGLVKWIGGALMLSSTTPPSVPLR